MNRDIKLSEQLKMDHESGDFGNALKGYSERAAMLETLGNKVAQQAAVIEKLLAALKVCFAPNGDDYKILNEALATPTDSKKVLADWMREQLGEPFAWASWLGSDNERNQLHARISCVEPKVYSNKLALFKLPECLK